MPVLWKEEYQGLLQFEEIEFSNEIIDVPSIKSNKRLGKLAENLFSVWLKNSKRYKIIFENLQIIENKKTLGELDVMLFDVINKEYIHLELITKFYLLNPEFKPNDIKAWVGPNRNDSLYDKVTKLKEKQLPLLYNKYTQEVVKPYLQKEWPVKQRVCFKANLFVPLDFEGEMLIFNPKCIVGHYLTLPQFKKLHKSSNQYFCPSKQDWLRNANTQKDWVNFEEALSVIQKFMDLDQSLMVWIKGQENFKRIIIVPYDYF